MSQKICTRIQQLSRKKRPPLGAISPWEDVPIPILPQLHADLVIDTGKNQWSTTWPTHGLGHRLSQ